MFYQINASTTYLLLLSLALEKQMKNLVRMKNFPDSWNFLTFDTFDTHTYVCCFD